MSFGQDSDGQIGLVFTTEQPADTNQSILFALPLPDQLVHPLKLIDLLEHEAIYFPFLLGDKYYNLRGEVSFPEVVFTVPGIGIQITFEIDGRELFDWTFYRPIKRKTNRLKYVGKQNNYIERNTTFLNLLPVDLLSMDDLYNDHGGVFVGFTPNFGSFEVTANLNQ
jgi:hypothetical protein